MWTGYVQNYCLPLGALAGNKKLYLGHIPFILAVGLSTEVLGVDYLANRSATSSSPYIGVARGNSIR